MIGIPSFKDDKFYRELTALSSERRLRATRSRELYVATRVLGSDAKTANDEEFEA